MLPGVTGSLVTEYFAEQFLSPMFGRELGADRGHAARTGLTASMRAARPHLGPVCTARHVYDLVAAPLVMALGFVPGGVRVDQKSGLVSASLSPGRPPRDPPFLVATAWGERLDSVWRDAVRASLAAGSSWCLCVNGTLVRLIDARRLYARRFVQFEIETVLEHDASFSLMWSLLRRDTLVAGAGRPPDRQAQFEQRPALIDRIVQASDRHAAVVCRSLREGVLEALAELVAGFARGSRGRPLAGDLDDIYGQALTIVYRILFLLFAESRRLVPAWHPVYRESYSLEAVLSLAEAPGRPRGIWEALQAISRLAHAGCRAGDLRVTPFNGRLFAPSVTPLGERTALDDQTARRALLALSTSIGPGGRIRISYRDLDVEQLGAVYESVLDYRPVAAAGRVSPPTARTPGSAIGAGGGRGAKLEPGSLVRKATGSFYTPRAITTYLVRQTLWPLVHDASPDEILSLRILDPAMGSGAFLVAACRFLATSYELALVRHGCCGAGDLGDRDRRSFRRVIAQRCLYGVDLNPMAVQLARLSMWLATLAPDRPLTFLDHRLVTGDSLVGASPDEVLRQPPPGVSGARARGRQADLPLFGPEALGPDIRGVLPGRTAVALREDDTAAAVREKERIVAELNGPRSPLARWKAVCDLWCAQAFLDRDRRADGVGVFWAVADHLLHGRGSVPQAVVERLLADARAASGQRHFFHWPLEFPEVFYDDDGVPLGRPGFDAVIGNPPWDMIRGDSGEGGERVKGRQDARSLALFARESGAYRAQGSGHGNRFQLFVERAHRLTREGGRLGLVAPWGLAADHGCAGLRRLLLDRSEVDALVGFENSRRIFPIHRSIRFLLLSATTGGPTSSVPARLGERDPAVLDELEHGQAGGSAPFPVVLGRGLIQRLSGGDAAIPDVRRRADLELLERLSGRAPALGDRAGWGVEFGRELNASDNRSEFRREGPGLPVLEGKHVTPFRAAVTAAPLRLPLSSAHRLLDASRTFARPRLAYRDVAGATNRLTLIAAVVPAGCVTVHTLFCLRTRVTLVEQRFLCAILNSFVANYHVRFRVTTHVTTAIVERIPVPRPPADSRNLRRLAALAASLARTPGPSNDRAFALLQAGVACLYGLTRDEFELILESFPLVDAEVRRSALDAFGG